MDDVRKEKAIKVNWKKAKYSAHILSDTNLFDNRRYKIPKIPKISLSENETYKETKEDALH